MRINCCCGTGEFENEKKKISCILDWKVKDFGVQGDQQNKNSIGGCKVIE